MPIPDAERRVDLGGGTTLVKRGRRREGCEHENEIIGG